MLSRVAVGLHEWNLRAALGATYWQLTRPILIEAFLLSTLGAVAGVPVAAWGIRAFRQWSLNGIFSTALPIDVAPDLRVLTFIFAAALSVAVLVSAGALGWLARRRHAGAGIGTGDRATRQRVGPALMTSQVAVSVVVITMSGLVARDLQELRSARGLHYERDGVLVFTLASQPNGRAGLDNDAYRPQLLERVLAIPGVETASLGTAPTPQLIATQRVSVPGTGERVDAETGRVSPGFFRTLRIPFVGGRDFTWGDDRRAAPVAIISQSLARRLFGPEPAIGRRVHLEGWDPMDADVIGVVADAKLYNFTHPTTFSVYLSQQQSDEPASHLLVRSAGAFPALESAVRHAIASFGHEYAWRWRTLEERTDEDFAHEWLVVKLAASFSALALILTGIGLYALLSHATLVRRKELGIRLALGASPHRLVVFIVAGGLRITATGIAIGAIGSWFASRLVAGNIVGVGSLDPVAWLASPLMLLLAATGACLVPAIRASRVDPSISLRAD
jgi:predicted permease